MQKGNNCFNGRTPTSQTEIDQVDVGSPHVVIDTVERSTNSKYVLAVRLIELLEQKDLQRKSSLGVRTLERKKENDDIEASNLYRKIHQINDVQEVERVNKVFLPL